MIRPKWVHSLARRFNLVPREELDAAVAALVALQAKYEAALDFNGETIGRAVRAEDRVRAVEAENTRILAGQARMAAMDAEAHELPRFLPWRPRWPFLLGIAA